MLYSDADQCTYVVEHRILCMSQPSSTSYLYHIANLCFDQQYWNGCHIDRKKTEARRRNIEIKSIRKKVAFAFLSPFNQIYVVLPPTTVAQVYHFQMVAIEGKNKQMESNQAAVICVVLTCSIRNRFTNVNQNLYVLERLVVLSLFRFISIEYA